MKSSELRIGNWVTHNEEWSYRNRKGEFRWNESDWYALGESTLFLENVSPIQLTEEWLLRFGFENSILNTWAIFPQEGYSSITIQKNEAGYFLTNLPIQIKYVHQLQNLYFALTGEELIIN